MNTEQWNEKINDLWNRRKEYYMNNCRPRKIEWSEMEGLMRDALKHYRLEDINAPDCCRVFDGLLAIYTGRGNVLDFITG